jgi:tetratricopeptide (TPR) repeat protein
MKSSPENNEGMKEIEKFTEELNKNPKDYQTYVYRAMAYGEKGLFGKSIADCDQAIEINPGFISAYSCRGMSYLGTKKYNEAIFDFNKVLEHDPNNVDVRYFRGIAKCKIKSFEAAISDCTVAIDKQAEEKAYYWRGLAYLGKRMQDEAYADLSKYLKCKPIDILSGRLKCKGCGDHYKIVVCEYCREHVVEYCAECHFDVANHKRNAERSQTDSAWESLGISGEFKPKSWLGQRKSRTQIATSN